VYQNTRYRPSGRVGKEKLRMGRVWNSKDEVLLMSIVKSLKGPEGKGLLWSRSGRLVSSWSLGARGEKGKLPMEG